MALEDLNLEFEDENEQKKDDALEVDVDLSFSASGDSPASRPAVPARPKSVARSVPQVSGDEVTDPNLRLPKEFSTNKNSPQTQAQGQVKSLDDARKNHNIQRKQVNQQTAAAQPQSKSAPSSSQGANTAVNHQTEIESLWEVIEQVRAEASAAKHVADVRIAVAEARAEYMAEQLSNAKLLDHQVNQILQRIHAKVPGLKNEVLMIKKYLGEFVKKGRSGDK